MGDVREEDAGVGQLRWLRLAPIALSTVFWIAMLAATVVIVRARS